MLNDFPRPMSHAPRFNFNGPLGSPICFAAFTLRGQRWGLWIGLNRERYFLPFVVWVKLNPAGEAHVIGWA